MRVYTILALAIAVLLLCGCAKAPEGGPFPPLQELALERAELDQEWRDARCLPAGKEQVYSLGTVPAQGVLRLGLLQAERRRDRVKARVYAGGKHVNTLKTKGKNEWCDFRVPFPEAVAGQECLAVFSSASPFYVAPCEIVEPKAEAANVLIFLIDALRLDHLGCYGYDRDTSPNIDGLAEDAVRFTHLMPQSSWTRPSVASLFTSTYPATHGAQDRPDIMRQNMPSLAKAFEQGGYETHGFMTNPNCIPVWGIGNDYNHYVDADSTLWTTTDDSGVTDAAIATLKNVQGRPWYMYVHTMGPHNPYTAPEPYTSRFVRGEYTGTKDQIKIQESMDLYDGEIAFTDYQFGRMVETLKELDVYDDTLIIVMADHGEEFGDHGSVGHGKTLFEEQLRIPFLVKLPDQAHAGETRDGLVQVIDIAPTLLDYLELPADERFQGRSFKEHLLGGDPEKRLGYASLFLEARSIRAAKTVEEKFLHDFVKDEKRWTDLTTDEYEHAPSMTPSPEDLALEQYCARMSMQGSEGFHLLVTGELDARQTVSGSVAGEGIESYELWYPAREGEASKTGDTVDFRIELREVSASIYGMAGWHEHVADQNSARLRLAVGIEDTVRVSVFVEGEPVPAESVFVGEAREHMPLNDTVLRCRDLLASPDSFDPAVLPRGFGVYIWYVADAATIADESLDPALRDALGALGYMD